MGLAGCGGTGSTGTILASTPTITGITPPSTDPGGVLTITGVNFTGTNTLVYFSGPTTQAQLYAGAGSTTSLTVNVPTTLNAGTYNITVVATDGIGDNSATSNAVQITLL